MRKKHQSKNLPLFAVSISTYSELEQYCAAFAAGHLNLLILLGPPGIAKSRTLRQVVDFQTFWIDGNVSAFGLYMEAYEHRNQRIVIDDPDALYGNRDGVRLLKTLCQTERIKTLTWLTDAKTLQTRDIPQQFSTTSQVAIVANDWKTANIDVSALEDRGHVVIFEPSALEIHRHAGRWFWDQEIFDLVGAHLHLIRNHSLRVYVHAWELKCAGLDWKRPILSRCLAGPALLVAKLKADPSYELEEDRAQAFVAAGAGCRATYFKHARAIRSAQPAKKIILSTTTPPAEPLPPEDSEDIFDQDNMLETDPIILKIRASEDERMANE